MVIACIIILVLLLIVLFTLHFFKRTTNTIRTAVLGKRFDDDHTLHYFSHNDYENMTQEKFSFLSNGNKLQGYLYQVTPLKRKGNIIFVHGIGAGHIQYTNDIHHYCEQGYDVYTFDGQGCLNSEGTGLEYFSNYVKNLDDFINYLKTKEELKEAKFTLVGHSLGGYAVNIISELHNDDIIRIVSFSGFNNVLQLMKDKFIPSLHGTGKILAKNFARIDKKNSPIHSLSTVDVITKNKPEILFIVGEEDTVVLRSTSFDVFKEKLNYLDNTHFMLVKARHHNPYVTKESAKYFTETRRQFEELTKEYKAIPDDKLKEYYDSLDYKLLVELDKNVMDVVDKFINGESIQKEIVVD